MSTLSEIFKQGEKFLEKANKAFLKQNWKQLNEFTTEAIKLFDQTRAYLKKADCFILLAKASLIQKNIPESIKFYHKTLAAQRKTNYSSLIGQTHLNLGHLYYLNQNFEEAHHHAQKSYDIAEQTNNISAKINSLYHLGKIYFIQNEAKSAEFYLLLAYDEISTEKYKNPLFEAKINALLGTVLTEQFKYQKAINHYQIALTIYQGTKNYTEIAGILLSLAEIYENVGNINKSLEYVLKSIHIYSNLNLSTKNLMLAKLFLKQAKLLALTEQPDQAEEICELSLELSEIHSFWKILVHGLLFMTQIKALETKKEDEQQLIWNYLTEAQNIAKRHHFFDMEVKIAIIEFELLQTFEKHAKIKDMIIKLENYLIKVKNKDIQVELKETLGLYYHKQKKYQIAAKYLKKLNKDIQFKIQPEIFASYYYNYVCNMIYLHETDEILDYLEIAFRMMPKYKDIAMKDKDLAILKDSQAFLDLLNN